MAGNRCLPLLSGWLLGRLPVANIANQPIKHVSNLCQVLVRPLLILGALDTIFRGLLFQSNNPLGVLLSVLD